jgi:uncharacterized membrane protein YphA (DoxX/SURF4 family)
VSTTQVAAAGSRWWAVRRWLGTLARLVLAGVWLAAGAAKIGDLAASGRAIHAYQLLPYELSVAMGAALPFVELLLGGLLLAGLATRVTAAVSAGLLVIFAAGIASAWARGLTIDCGCFGGGGELAAGADPSYAPELARSVTLAVLSFGLARWPGSWLAADSLLVGGDPTEPDEEEEE